MADKRMFAKSIIESDPFMDMPAEAQMLYIHLNLAADDDGFVDRPRSVMRACGASNDSMKLLIAKKFVLAFDRNDNFIVVVKHWKMHNYIRKDTYRETKYRELMRELYYDENKAYSMNPGEGHLPCIPSETSPSRTCDESVTEPSRTRLESLTQDRLEQNRKEQNSLIQANQGERGTGEEERPPADSLMDSSMRRELIARWRNKIDIFRRLKYDPEHIYRIAEAAGVSREEIDNYKEEIS